MNFKVGFKTDIGRIREKNQDSGAVYPEHGLFVVADGMGGHQGGETASAMAVEKIFDHVNKVQKKDGWDPADTIRGAIEQANHAIHERAQKDDSLRGMGTTVTSLLFKEGQLFIGHVGDSRCYFFHKEPESGRAKMWQLTRDHSLVEEKFRAGLITREQVKTDTMKNVITRSVGFEPQVQVEVYEMDVQPGDAFLICSDGLSGMLDDPEIRDLVEKDLIAADDIERTVQDLVSTANRNGGDDNITALLVQVNT